MMAAEEQQEGAGAARAWLGRQLRLTLVDRRVVAGALHALDGRGNLVLRHTQEWAEPRVVAGETPTEAARRFMGTVVVSLDNVVRVETLPRGAAAQ